MTKTDQSEIRSGLSTQRLYGTFAVPPETRASLLIRIRNPEDSDSWTQFGEVYAPVVFRFLTRRGLQEADAGDVTQNVLLEVAKSIQKFEYEPERGKFRNWLATIARRQLNRFLEQKSCANC